MILPLLLGLSGLELTAEEREFLREARPAGVLLFARNIQSVEQVRDLCAQIRALLPLEIPPLIAVDQEGGRVQRLVFHGRYPPMGVWRKVADGGGEEAARGVYLEAFLLATDLLEVGANWVLGPVTDLLVDDADKIIGDRAFGKSPALIARLAEAFMDGVRDAGGYSCLKHLPGHGRAAVDSHHGLPVVLEPLELLEQTDFAAFKPLLPKADFAMTAHVVYSALDARPATYSPLILNDMLRKQWGFGGCVVSDDVGMAALKEDYIDRVRLSLEGGCDLVIASLSKLQHGMAGTVFHDEHFAALQRDWRKIPPLSPKALERLNAMPRPVAPSAHVIAQARSDFERLCRDVGVIIG